MGIALVILLGFAGLAFGSVWLVRSLRAELEGLRADSGAQLAERMAASEADLHLAVDLVAAGCTPETAAEILL